MTEDEAPPGAEDFQSLREARTREQLLAFARDVNELYRRERDRTRELNDALAELQEAYLSIVETLAFVVEARDPATKQHLERTKHYAVMLARRVAPELADSPGLVYGSLLHDIGKIGVPEAIVGKGDTLTDDEWDLMRLHPIIGGQICRGMRFLETAIPVIEGHHERWDGEGYPRRLKGEEIPLPARIFAVADSFDAMTSNRPYRDALPFDRAVEQIRAAGGTQFDPACVAAFVEICEAGSWELAVPDTGAGAAVLPPALEQ